MGWLTPDEQQAFYKKYRVRIYYTCDHCSKPIMNAPLVDPRGGFHSWPKRLSKGARMLCGREPKRTYHTAPCGVELFSKKGRKEKLFRDIAQLADRILQRISKRKPKGYWTKERIIKRYKRKFESKIIKKALSLLRKEKKIRKRQGGFIAKSNKTVNKK